MIGQGAIAPLAAVFDYSQLTEDCQGELFAAAERIKTRVKRQTIDHIEIGRELLKVKDQLEHGVFLEWIAAEFPFSARSAQRYMAAAEFAGDEYDSLSHLPAELLYDLASKTTPDAIKNEVRADLGAGKPVDVKVVKARIKAARKTSRQPEPPIPYVPAPPKIDLLPTPKQQAETEASAETHIFERQFGPLSGVEWMRLGEDCYSRPIKRGPFKRPGQYSDEFMKLVAHFDVPLKDLEAAE
jgi:hypothetical protein